jgi:hypothetical protein
MTVNRIRFQGVNAVELADDKLRLVAMYEFGPRIAFFGKHDGENLLLWEPEAYKRKEWDLRGGHRIWLTRPGADECEESYSPDNKACTLEQTDEGFRITGTEDPRNRTKRGIDIRKTGKNTIEVDNFVINSGDMLFSCGVWGITCTVPRKRTRYLVPVGDDSAWDAFHQVIFRAWAGHSGGCNDSQFSFTDDMLCVEPKGKENKRMIQAHKGIIAMDDPDLDITFAKRASFKREARYPHRRNIAVYIGPENFMVEMETMGPEQTLKPGESLHHIETWLLVSRHVHPENTESLEKLF